MTRTILALLLVLGQFSLVAAPRRRAVQPPPPVTAPAALITAARQAADASIAKGVPAVQIAVLQGGRVVYSEAFGVTDKQSATAATSRSVMQIGSLTKQFTAAAILRLAERGALSLDDRIEKYVPEFNPRGATITLRTILSHRSGIPRDWYKLTGHTLPPLFEPVSRETVITSLNAQPLMFTPGSQFSYSNAGYQLLGYAIESITGTPYVDFIRNEFVLPLGLLDTGVCGTSTLPRPEGYGVYPDEVVRRAAVHPSGLISSGSLCSTAWDLGRWSHLLATGSVLLPASYATMTTRPPAAIGTYGFGVDLKNVLGRPAVSHDGAIDGFMSYLIYFPERDISVAIIVNAFPIISSASAGLVLESENVALAVAKAALDSL